MTGDPDASNTPSTMPGPSTSSSATSSRANTVSANNNRKKRVAASSPTPPSSSKVASLTVSTSSAPTDANATSGVAESSSSAQTSSAGAGPSSSSAPTSTNPAPASSPTVDKNVRPRVLNRVPRACNACRKQKMRCEGADDPPCKRCRHAGFECLFEKPVRDVTTSEQGMERIRNLESEVLGMKSLLGDLVSAIRAGNSQQGALPTPGPSTASSSAATGPAGVSSPAGSASHQRPPPPPGSAPPDGPYYHPQAPGGGHPYHGHPVVGALSPSQSIRTQGSAESPNSVSEMSASVSGTSGAVPPSMQGHRNSHSQSLTTPSPRFPPGGSTSSAGGGPGGYEGPSMNGPGGGAGPNPGAVAPGSGPGPGHQVVVGPNGQQQVIPMEQLPPSHHQYPGGPPSGMTPSPASNGGSGPNPDLAYPNGAQPHHPHQHPNPQHQQNPYPYGHPHHQAWIAHQEEQLRHQAHQRQQQQAQQQQQMQQHGPPRDPQHPELERQNSMPRDRDAHSYSPPEQVSNSFHGPMNGAEAQAQMQQQQQYPPGHPAYVHPQHPQHGQLMGPPSHIPPQQQQQQQQMLYQQHQQYVNPAQHRHPHPHPQHPQHPQHPHQQQQQQYMQQQQQAQQQANARGIGPGDQQVPYSPLEDVAQQHQNHPQGPPPPHQLAQGGRPYSGPPYVQGAGPLGPQQQQQHLANGGGPHGPQPPQHPQQGPIPPHVQSSSHPPQQPDDSPRQNQRSHMPPQFSPSTVHATSYALRGPIHHDNTVDYGIYARSAMRGAGSGSHAGYGRGAHRHHSQSPTHSHSMASSHSQSQGFPLNASSLSILANSGGTRPSHGGSAGGRRRGTGVPSSAVTSADSSDAEDELPSAGFVAPFAVLRGMADRAERREAGGDRADRADTSASHTRSPSPEIPDGLRAVGAGDKRESRSQGGRSSKRRKIRRSRGGFATTPLGQIYPDVVTIGVIGQQEALELFKIFYHGCSTFLPVFDPTHDTFEALHQRSPFCVNAICMVAAKVRDGGGNQSDVVRRLQEETQKIACATLFAPVTRQEAVQATIIIAGWSTDGGWLSLGHAVRMAFEINMHKTWPRLLKRLKSGKLTLDADERELVISTRTWLCLYVFEHQLALGTGRPMILHDDESIRECRLFLNHPFAIKDDLRLVSMVELGMIKERVHKSLFTVSTEVSPTPIDVYEILSASSHEFNEWVNYWDGRFRARQDYSDVDFQRQSLEVQRMFAELFHNATALRSIRTHPIAATIPKEQRVLAMYSIKLARQGLETCLRSTNYREGLKFAVHFTHVSATFAASFLIRLSRQFPDELDLRKVMLDVEELITALGSIPATRYARTLRLMLDRARQRNILPPRSNPPGKIEQGEPVEQPEIPENLPTAAELGMQVTAASMTMDMNQQPIPMLPPQEMVTHPEPSQAPMEGANGTGVLVSPSVETSGIPHMTNGGMGSPSSFVPDLPVAAAGGLENYDNGSYLYSRSDRPHEPPSSASASASRPPRPSSESLDSESNVFEHSDVTTANWIISEALLQDMNVLPQQFGLDSYGIPPWDTDMQRHATQIW